MPIQMSLDFLALTLWNNPARFGRHEHKNGNERCLDVCVADIWSGCFSVWIQNVSPGPYSPAPSLVLDPRRPACLRCSPTLSHPTHNCSSAKALS